MQLIEDGPGFLKTNLVVAAALTKSLEEELQIGNATRTRDEHGVAVVVYA